MDGDKFEARGIVYTLLNCRLCKGRGWIWNPKGRDKKCQCRIDAKNWLREQE